MALSPRQSGRMVARVEHSPSETRFLDRIAPFFADKELAGGPLALAALIALICTNLPFSGRYEAFWDMNLALSLGEIRIAHSLAEWIDHALLPLLFVIIGADVKREFMRGSLSSWRTAMFPLSGAVGGLVVPVGLFLLIAQDPADRTGWGTVVTMDTAFSLAIIGLFATSLPTGLRALLLAFAALDDVGGLAVIAIAYTQTIELTGLLVVAFALSGLVGLRRLGWVASVPYVLLSLILWAGMLDSGVHTTIAGVLVGLTIPVHPRLDPDSFSQQIQGSVDEFQEAHSAAQKAEGDDQDNVARKRAEDRLGYLNEMTDATGEASERVITILNPWVSYVVLPLFALSNIRIHFSTDMMGTVGSPLVLAIIAGLVLGKPLGFLSFSWLATRLGFAQRPEAVTWPMIGAIGALAGIGFTISLFIAGLAFHAQDQRESASLAILIASCCSALVGFAALRSLAGNKDASARD